MLSCCCYHKGTYFQANHNLSPNTSVILLLLLLPQRYVFSSKSQHAKGGMYEEFSCCCYHKGTYFQANHNLQTLYPLILIRCCCYHKGTYFQANHNYLLNLLPLFLVVVATTKVRIFKQITTISHCKSTTIMLLLLPQRYVFSSKSQRRYA